MTNDPTTIHDIRAVLAAVKTWAVSDMAMDPDEHDMQSLRSRLADARLLAEPPGREAIMDLIYRLNPMCSSGDGWRAVDAILALFPAHPTPNPPLRASHNAPAYDVGACDCELGAQSVAAPETTSPGTVAKEDRGPYTVNSIGYLSRGIWTISAGEAAAELNRLSAALADSAERHRVTEKDACMWASRTSSAEADLSTAQATIGRYETALKFYGGRHNWVVGRANAQSDITRDGGQIARTALEGGE